jgi:DNA-directed RNA polymerase specialized sigma24 family protein
MSVQMTQEQTAKELGISLATVERTWAFARAGLFRDLEKSRNAPS